MTTPNTQAQGQAPNAAPAVTTPAPAAPVITGGPEATFGAPAPQGGAAASAPAPGGGQAAPAAQGSPAPVAAAPTMIVIGNRTFHSKDEALAYAQELERQRAIQEAARVPQTQPQPQQNKPKISDILFDDPDTAIKIIKDELRQEIDQDSQKKTTHDRIWSDFYDKNPDLKGFEEVVEIQKNRHWSAIANLPVAQSLPMLANEARSFLSKVRGNTNSGEQLPSSPAVVAGSSGPTPPATPVPAAKTSNFLDEVSALRKRRAK